jgi:hypothetical protein
MAARCDKVGKMKHTPSYSPYTHHIRSASFKAAQARDAADFLRSNNALSAILPTASRLVALQNECATIMPSMFKACEVLHLSEGQLTLRTPNAALAAKLKQQLPTLQSQLIARGWQVNTIRIKVQMKTPTAPRPPHQPPILPTGAVSAFHALASALEDSPRNQSLKTALASILRRNSAGQ